MIVFKGIYITLLPSRNCWCQWLRSLWSFYPRARSPSKCMATRRPTPAGTWRCGTSEWFRPRRGPWENGAVTFAKLKLARSGPGMHSLFAVRCSHMTSVTVKRCRYVVAVIVKLKLECFDSQHAKQCFHFTWICHNWATLTTSRFAYTYINISNKSRHDLCITRIIIYPISGLLWDIQTCNLCVCVFSFTSRWSEVTRRLELWVQVMELNEAGVFAAVEVVPAKDVRTGGVFQLRQVASDRLCLSGFSPFFLF